MSHRIPLICHTPENRATMKLTHQMGQATNKRRDLQCTHPRIGNVIKYQVEVRAIAGQHDVQAQRLAREILNLPLKHPPALRSTPTTSPPFTIRTAQLYLITGTLTPSQIDLLTSQLLIDPVIQTAKIISSLESDLPGELSATKSQIPNHNTHHERAQSAHIVDIFFHAGVTDTLAESVLAGASMLGITGIDRVETGHRYWLDPRLNEHDVQTITQALLYNPVIQHYALQPSQASSMEHLTMSSNANNVVASLVGARSISLSSMTGLQLLELSKSGMLALSLDEMQAIQRYFLEQGREPTDVELETLAQTWSEHCSHKTFKATINYREFDSHGNELAQETIPGLLKHYIMQATEQLQRPWVVSAFSDNAGIVQLSDLSWDIAFKVETHNHPSAIEPFGGANTGAGGVIRDVLGVSAQPIACTDILCFGPPDTPVETLPAGMLSPRRIASGVVDGVRDYGNKMGIPTVNGAVLYHPGYIYNPLVFCGCLGILPHGSHPNHVQPGDLIVVLGGRTGRDGIHGATFSSGEMSSEANAQAGSAVQIGAPITEKKVTDVIIQARDHQLYHAITDCGAGGFSSAIGEMGAQTGARVELSQAPLKYQGLAPWEIWLSEAQERMVLAVPPEHLKALQAICALEEVEVSIIGTFTGDRRLTVTYHGQCVADVDMAFLHTGRPSKTLEAVWVRPNDEMRSSAIHRAATHDIEMCSSILLSLLGHPTIASKEAIIRRYDHEVQGATVLKPLVGRAGNGPGDATALQPILDQPTQAGIILSNGINPLYGTIDPYYMAMNAIDEALRNLTAVGGDIERVAILDNFCWGNPNDPIQLGMLVRAVKGCHDAAVGFGTPFISGKDSLHNEYRVDDQRLPVIPTLLISAVGVIDDAAQTIDMSLKAPGNLLYLVGLSGNELAGSHYAELLRTSNDRDLPYLSATNVPQVDLPSARSIMKALGIAIRKGLVSACHDLSEGGLAVAAAEMALAGLLGMDIDLARVPCTGIEVSDERNTIILFSEAPSRFLVEISPEQRDAFEAHMHTHNVQHLACIGTVNDTDRFIVRNDEQIVIDLPVAQLQQAWKGEEA
jgi:phosphoribosylformylglycinamidine synthase II